MTAQRTSCTINILFADDGSEHAQAAIEFLRDMPLSSQSKVTALAVLIPRETANHALLETILDQTRARLQSKDILLETELKLGYPGEILLEYAEQHKPDLIVMGAKGLRATLGILLGGVAQHVIEYANCPVIIIRAPYTGLHNILVVSDGSQSSQKAVAAICCADEVRPSPKTQIPLPAEANYHVAHVLPPLPSPELLARSWPVGPDMMPPYTPKPEINEGWLREEQEQGQAIVDQAVAQMKQAGFNVSGVVLRGDAATEIIKFVKERHVDLIVSGSRGLSQIKGLLLGSVSRKLVHYAGCSVLVVK